MTNQPKVKPVCTRCGSDDVRRDAYAIWSIPNQEWELLATFDNTDCEQCGGECSLIDVSA